MFERGSNTLWDYIDESTFTAVKQRSEEVVGSERDPARSITFLSDKNPVDLFKKRELGKFEVQTEEHDNFWEVSISRTIKRKQYEDGYRVIEGKFLLYQNDVDDVWTALTISGREFYEKAVKRYLESLTPEISLAYLSTDEMRRLFESLEEEVEGRIVVEKAVIYSHEKDANISFEKREFHEVFNEAENQNKYVDKLDFSIKNDGDAFEGYLTRHGDSRYASGSSKVYYDIILESLASLISDKGELFSNKSREYGSRDSKPIEIQFDESAIKSTEDNVQVIDALGNIKRSSLTVYHKNPYLHASLIDYTDGSSADVFIVSERNISIVPSFNSSKSALMKICDRITQEFQEGEVRERAEVNREFDDYFR